MAVKRSRLPEAERFYEEQCEEAVSILKTKVNKAKSKGSNIIGSKNAVWYGLATKTVGGLRKKDLFRAKDGKIKSIARSNVSRERMRRIGTPQQRKERLMPQLAKDRPLSADEIRDHLKWYNTRFKRAQSKESLVAWAIKKLGKASITNIQKTLEVIEQFYT